MQSTQRDSNEMNLDNINLRAYKSTHDRRQWVVRLLYLMALLAAITIISDLMEINLLNRIINGERVTMQEVDANDSRAIAISGIYILALIVTGVTYVSWLYRAYNNLNALTPYGTDRTPKWAVLGFIIPIINLFYPYQIVREIWRETLPRNNPQERMGDRVISPSDLKWWWAMFLISNSLSRGVGRSFRNSDTLESLRNADYASIFASIFLIGAAFMAVQVVQMVDDQQQNYYAWLRTAPKSTSTDTRSYWERIKAGSGHPNDT